MPKLFQMRYRHNIEGIQHGFIELIPKKGETAEAMQARAEKMGRDYCEKSQARFIWCRDAILISDRSAATEKSAV